jgi:hypothetical protein
MPLKPVPATRPIDISNGVPTLATAYVEKERVSPLGWAVVVVGCFTCPIFNFLGLLIREKHYEKIIPAAPRLEPYDSKS